VLLPVFSDQHVSSDPGNKRPESSSKVRTPEPKKNVRRLTGKIKGPSIKDALAGKLGEEQLSSREQHEMFTRTGETRDFTAEELKQKWDEFVRRLKDRPNLQSTLSRVPSVKEGYRLVLTIDNSVQDDLINHIKPELISWLRNELRNSKILLTTQIDETEKEKIIYTDAEKYVEMVKKNPRLELLKKKFKLDFE
jgi:hypothetical protein